MKSEFILVDPANNDNSTGFFAGLLTDSKLYLKAALDQIVSVLNPIYEEWTPTMAGITLDSAKGLCRKQGKMVTLSFSIQLPVNTNTAAMQIGALPYSPGKMGFAGSFIYPGVLIGHGTSFFSTEFGLNLNDSASVLNITKTGTTTAAAEQQEFSGKLATGQLTYFTD